MPDRVNSANFLTHMVYVKTSLSKFQRIFHSPQNGGQFFGYVSKLLYPISPQNFEKWGSLSIFKFLTKSAKHQIASVSLTVQDRAISSKFLKHTVSKITTLPKKNFSYILALLSYKQNFLCQLTCQSADIMSSLCGVGVRVRVNNFFSKTTRPRDMLFFLKDTLSIEDEKVFKACKSVCSSVC